MICIYRYCNCYKLQIQYFNVDLRLELVSKDVQTHQDPPRVVETIDEEEKEEEKEGKKNKKQKVDWNLRIV